MIRFLATALLLLVTCSIAQAQVPQWVEYKPAGAGFRVEFPTAPTIETEDDHSDLGPMRTTTAEIVVKGEVIYTASDTTLPPGITADPNDVLEGTRKGFIESSKTKLRRERRFTMDGLPARRLVLDAAEKNYSVVAILVCSSDRIYSISVVVPPGEEKGETAERFLKSFALVSK